MQIKTDAAHMISLLDKFKADFSEVGHGGFGKQQLTAAEKAVEALDTFVKSLAPLDSLAKYFQTNVSTRAGAPKGGTRKKSPCLKCEAEGIKPPKDGQGGRVGRFCEDHKDISQGEKDKLKKKAA